MTTERDAVTGPLERQVRWRPVREFEGVYEVADDGSVRSLARTVWAGNRPYRVRQRIMRGGTTNGRTVLLQFEGLQVPARTARLVWEAFNGSVPDGLYVLHENGDELDCRLANLLVGDQAKAERLKAQRIDKANGARVPWCLTPTGQQKGPARACIAPPNAELSGLGRKGQR